MFHNFFLITILLSLLSSSMFANYETYNIGKIENIYGEVFVNRLYKKYKPFQGYIINRDDTIFTKQFSGCQIRFDNGTIFIIKENQNININKLLKNNKKFLINISK